MAMNTDLYLIKRIARDDAEAFELLFKKYYRMVYNYARYYISIPDHCHDIVQEVFTYVWENRSSMDVKSSLKSYLLKSCHNACINFLKKNSFCFNFHLKNLIYGKAKKTAFYWDWNSHLVNCWAVQWIPTRVF